MRNYRFLLRGYDTRSLYRKYNAMRGVNTENPAHLNIHEWLDPKSTGYNQMLAEAIFHYSARASKDSHFEICISTPEMKEAAWKYAHQSQVILDGTFGICDAKILLFIIMGIDENRHGIPLAFLFFSAPSGNRKTDAGYNTEILVKLLCAWKTSLGSRNNIPFDVHVAITDTDLKEQGALFTVFPNIWLLICKFHLRQSWRNQHNKILKGTTPTHTLLKNRLHLLESQLIETIVFVQAQLLVAKERVAVEEMLNEDPEHEAIYSAVLAHLKDYFLGYWMTPALWSSWSDFGRKVAAGRLNCPFEGVLPTTNHLESFNGLLKRKYLQRWQNGGRRL